MFRYVLFLFAVSVMGGGFSARAEEQASVDTLIKQVTNYLNTDPEKSSVPLAQLTLRRSQFNKEQEERYYLVYASSLGFRGKHNERVTLVESFIEKVAAPELRVKFLYQLSDGYTNLGDYPKALNAMNQSIVLLPKLTSIGAKVTVLQAAVTLFISLRAYEEALLYTERMSSLEGDSVSSRAKCYALANRVEISFLQEKKEVARELAPLASNVCDANDRKVITRIVRALVAIDMIDSGRVEDGRAIALPLLSEFLKTNATSDYVAQLNDAIARSYVKSGNLALADQYASDAYRRAKSENVVELMEKTSETMASIKRAQGQLNSALEYYDINLVLKKKVLDDQLQKNLAYQRVKFDTQDKTNQLALLEQKNKILNVEKKLAQRNKESLLLLISLAAILLTILLAWLLRTLHQKNIFRTSAQIDGLTLVSNRSHFVACALSLFHKPGKQVSVVLFDMDLFKKINDTFGHAAGDWVLKTVCQTVKAELGKTAQAGILGRLGGEEFAICLSDISEAEVLAMAERCRIAVAEIDTSACGYRFPISASFGIASRGQYGLLSFEETLAAADKALYFSKSEGRNRVSVGP